MLRVPFNRFVFHSPISAFALEIFDVDLSSVYGDGFSELLFLDIDERRFLGIVLDSPISSIVFSVDYETCHVDDVRRVSAIPEPSTALLLGAGLAAVATRRPRTRPSAHAPPPSSDT